MTHGILRRQGVRGSRVGFLALITSSKKSTNNLQEIGGSTQFSHEEVSNSRHRCVDVCFLQFSRGGDGAGEDFLSVAAVSARAGHVWTLRIGFEHDQSRHAER